MRLLVLCCSVALFGAGCATISTELDPGGSPKYKTAVRSTGTNMSRRFAAADAPQTKTLGDKEDVDRLFRSGGSNRQPGQN